MDLKVISSGSKGNTVAVISGESALLVDLGLPKTKADRMLLENGISMTSVVGVLVTHSHGDHIAGIPLAEKYSVPVYASAGTFKTLNCENSVVIKEGEVYQVGVFSCSAFLTYHDDFSSFGYVISDGEKKVSVLLDTGKVTQEMINAMMGSDIFVIESNYDEDLLMMNDKYPDSVRARIASDYGHLSNVQTAEALGKLITGKGEQIYLAHLSGANNNPTIAMSEVVKVLKLKGFKMNVDYTIGVV